MKSNYTRKEMVYVYWNVYNDFCLELTQKMKDSQKQIEQSQKQIEQLQKQVQHLQGN